MNTDVMVLVFFIILLFAYTLGFGLGWRSARRSLRDRYVERLQVLAWRLARLESADRDEAEVLQ